MTLPPPTGLTVSGQSGTSAFASWDHEFGATTYGVWLDGRFLGGVDCCAAYLQDLAAGSHTVSVAGWNSNEGTGYQATYGFTQAPSALAPPTGLHVYGQSGSSAFAAWDQEAGAETYAVWLDGTSLGGVSCCSAFLQNISPGSHTVSVAGWNHVQGIGYQATYGFVQPGAGQGPPPPALTAPPGLTVYGQSGTSAFASWGSVTGAETYDVHLDGQDLGGVACCAAFLQSLTPGVHSLTVAGWNSTEGVGPVAAISFTQPSSPQPTPQPGPGPGPGPAPSPGNATAAWLVVGGAAGIGALLLLTRHHQAPAPAVPA